MKTIPDSLMNTPDPESESEIPVFLIRPTAAWQFLDLRELWAYRELVYFLVWRDIKVRYKQTATGVLAEETEVKPKPMVEIGGRPSSCEVDNILRGRSLLKGVITSALATLCEWVFETLEAKRVYLRVFSHNKTAIELYRRCGFKEFKHTGLKRVVRSGMSQWVELAEDASETPAAYLTYMELAGHAR